MTEEQEQEILEEYEEHMHAIQSGVAMLMNYPDSRMGDAKHMQVGVLSAMVTDHAVATLLIEKGVFTKEEYFTQLVESAKEERERIRNQAQRYMGDTRITFM